MIFTAAVPFIFAVDVVIIDLADFHAGVNADRLYAEDFQGPVSVSYTHLDVYKRQIYRLSSFRRLST